MLRWSLFRQVLFGISLALVVALAAVITVSEQQIKPAFAGIVAGETRPLAEAVADLLVGQDLQAEVSRLGPRIGRRISIVAFDGRVLADSDVAPERVPNMENHAHRREVEAALATGWGWDSRQSATLGEPFLYVALRDDAKHRIVRIAVPLAEYEQAIARIESGLWTGLAIGGLIALLVAFGIARRLGSQVEDLVRVAKRQAAGQTAQFAEPGNREFGELARALNQMTGQNRLRLSELEAERARLRTVLDNLDEGVILCEADGRVVLWNGAAAQLFGFERSPEGKALIELTRIPEIIRLSESVQEASSPITQEFEEGNRSILATFVPMPSGAYLAVFHDISRLKLADRIRRDFVANVSHELRTPLASISGYAESLLTGALDDSSVARTFVDGIWRNSERLTQLIEDLLDLARIESGRYGLAPESIELHDAVAAAATLVTKLSSKKQPFTNQVAAGTFVMADRKGLNQVLVNLIDNASKYSPPGSPIEVGAETIGGLITFSVKDSGQGIPPEDLPRIFERFYRGDKSRNAAGEPGTGLGLAICKHLVNEMDGSIGVRSSGRGTTVSITLPAA